MENARSKRYMSDLETSKISLQSKFDQTSKISLQSKFDQTSKISKSVFISNFSDDCTSRDLWKVCNDYGTVVDVFIPNKKSKAEKRFAFVRFIKVLNFDRLIKNLKTIWIGRFHLSANPAQFDRPKAPTFQKVKPVSSGNVTGWIKCDYFDTSFSFEADFGGEMVELEDGYDDLFARKRICIKTSQTENILKSFKLIVKGKVFWARAKELFVWSPSFKEVTEKVICSDDESVKINEEANSLNNGVEESDSDVVSDTYFGDNSEDQGLEHQQEVPEKVICSDDESVKINEVANSLNNRVEESDSDVVSDTYFGDNGEDQGLEHQQGESSNAKEVSSDPFNIYDLLDKRTKEVRTTDTTTSIPYPLEVANSVDKSSSESINNGIKLNEGGSILEILEEMITVGQTMGFSMEGCTKDMEKIIGTQGEQVVFS
nr:RNA-directed DNA polymerase, eukaryota, nucleotide-binding alpha-beta plait domain protein [Tanacetum cinerariifolium]